MGERKAGLGTSSSPEQLERDVESIRESIDPVVNELDYRRHAVTHLSQRLLHIAPTVAKGVAIALGIMAAVKTVHRRRRSRAMLRT